ncbi:MAG: DoxX family protein [Bryobacteraceae bacterium]|nr:DoxX family protein [Bryobacteraceae bacterium]
MNHLERFTPLAGRILLAQIFLASGLSKVGSWDQTAGYMASRGMPLVPLFLVLAILLEVGGGLSVLLGYKTRLGAALLIVFLVAATLIFHNFWTYPGPEQQIQMIMFMKNLAIMGGLALLVGRGAGPLSLDERQRP